MGMTERAAAVGGTVAARRLPHGFRVEAQLPYAR
jgi:signal transduction histidine kinase